MPESVGLRPQPGAVEGNNSNHWDVREDVVSNYPDWPPLPLEKALTFVSAEPVFILDTGTGTVPFPGPSVLSFPLYRVWGDPAWEVGGFWTLKEIPEEEAEFYGTRAVQFRWDSGRYQAKLNNDGAAAPFVKAWMGVAAMQPADGVEADGQPAKEGPYPGYHLPGGVVQIWMPNGTLPWIDCDHTKWNPKPARPAPGTVAEPAELPTIPALNPGSAPGPEHYKVLADLVGILASRLAATDAQLALPPTRHTPLTAQARQLHSTVGALNTHMTYFGDAEAKSRSKLIAQSLVFIARYVDTCALPPAYASPIDDVIGEIVRLALAIERSP
jgi:hypothetical protein